MVVDLCHYCFVVVASNTSNDKISKGPMRYMTAVGGMTWIVAGIA